MSLFYIKFFITNILFSLIIGAGFVRFARSRENRDYTTFELMLYSLGLGPIFTVLLLYYTLLLVPQKRSVFYLTVVFLVYLLLAVWSRKGFVVLWKQFANFIASARGRFKAAALAARIKTTLYWSVLFLLLGLFLIGYNGTVKHNRMEGHDALIYGNFGKMYHKQRKITYAKVMLPGPNGFIFKGSPKPAFSLLLTWELMLNGKSAAKTKHFDTYYRSISGYYGLLIIALCFLWLFRKNRYLALLSVFFLVAAHSFYLMLLDHHLDSFRIFFLLLSWIWLAYTVKYGKQGDRFSFFLLALFSGFAAFAHSIGLIIALINIFTYFVFCEEPLKQRSIRTAVFTGFIILFGGFHYVMEIIYGAASGFTSYLPF